MVRWGLRLVLVSVLMSVVVGCTSMRYKSNLHPDVSSSSPLGKVRIHMVTVEGPDPSHQLKSLSTVAAKLYPENFSDDFSALPVRVETQSTFRSPFSPLGLLGGATLGALPIYITSYRNYTVNAQLATEEETFPLRPTSFEIKTASWGTLLTPLALIPVPGGADARCGGIGSGALCPNDLAETSTVAAVVQALKQLDSATLQQSYASRQARIQQVTVDGRLRWAFLGFRYADPKQNAGKRDLATVIFYSDAPTWQSTPMESVVVARRNPDGSWRPVTGYLQTATPLTSVNALLDQGRPTQVVVRTVLEPPLEDFIDTPDLTGSTGAETLRWNNGILLEAKNRSLPKLLRDRSRGELLDLVTRIERAALDLNEQAERAKDRAQRMVEKGEGDPGPERELAILCRQRIEVLKPILMELKQEAALR